VVWLSCSAASGVGRQISIISELDRRSLLMPKLTTGCFVKLFGG